jgi:2-keto-4-pentenoate hydratase/2-oxohepta-3-ene-1,7-dioic acid hydratase in catechol pathway
MRLYAVGSDDGPQLAEGVGGTELSFASTPAGVHPALAGRLAPVGGHAGPVRPDAEILAPLRPGKIVAIGLNYQDHIRETGMDAPAAPLVFAKFPSSIIGPNDPIVVDSSLAARVDWEVELGVVVGRRMRHVPVPETLDYVFGYTVANDVSARDVQFADGQWVRGKSFDTFCPMGPCIVTADEVPDPQALRLTTKVNGELVQDSSTSEMIFGVAEILSYVSRSFTLDPGDLVLTGTPWGCGEFMDPVRSLAPGDLVETFIERIGSLVNPVVAERGVTESYEASSGLPVR